MLFSSVSAVACACVISAAAAANPCTNGSFEELTAQGFPADWMPVGSSGGTQHRRALGNALRADGAHGRHPGHGNRLEPRLRFRHEKGRSDARPAQRRHRLLVQSGVGPKRRVVRLRDRHGCRWRGENGGHASQVRRTAAPRRGRAMAPWSAEVRFQRESQSPLGAVCRADRGDGRRVVAGRRVLRRAGRHVAAGRRNSAGRRPRSPRRIVPGPREDRERRRCRRVWSQGDDPIASGSDRNACRSANRSPGPRPRDARGVEGSGQPAQHGAIRGDGSCRRCGRARPSGFAFRSGDPQFRPRRSRRGRRPAGGRRVRAGEHRPSDRGESRRRVYVWIGNQPSNPARDSAGPDGRIAGPVLCPRNNPRRSARPSAHRPTESPMP